MLFTKETLDDAAIAKLKTDNGPDLRAVYTSQGIIIFRKPTRPEWDRWQDKNLVSKANAQADARELCQAALAKPCEYTDLIACLDATPGLLQGEFMSALLEMAGGLAKDAAEVKKL